jgi:8-oxo-dGTP pyrophosphatase MutT (NUDIX family)
MANYVFDDALRARMSGNLHGFTRLNEDRSHLRAAAVAIVVTSHPERDEAVFLITVRSSQLRRHAGQYALPGGRVDTGETLQAAAFRETREELGLDLSDRDLLGRLDDMPTRSGFSISPFIFWCPPTQPLRPDPTEVERVIHIPLSDLDSPEIPTMEPQEDMEEPAMCAPIATLGHQVYAPTAAMLYQFREVALHGRETRVHHFEQPKFAWR